MNLRVLAGAAGLLACTCVQAADTSYPQRTIRYIVPYAAGGAADVLSDGAQTVAADDLVLTEGTYVSDGQGASVLHLAFGSSSGTLTIDVPTIDGTWTWEPGDGVANQGVSFSLGDLGVDAGATGCEVDVAPTDLGGVQGSYLCTVIDGGTASGAFIANP